MRFQELENALTANHTIRIQDGQVHIGSDSLDKTLPTENLTSFYGAAGIEIASVIAAASSARKLVVRGKTSFSKLMLTAPTDVLATLELLDGPETLALTLRYTLPLEWRFQDSFPTLPFFVNDSGPQPSPRGIETVLDTFRLKRCSFYWTTYKHTLADDDLGGDLSLEPGLTFAGHWAPDGMLGAFERLIKSGSPREKILYGPVILAGDDPLFPLKDGQLPWNVLPRIPGIHLQADLGFELSFPPNSEAGMKLNPLSFQIYSPLTSIPQADVPEYDVAIAYAGDLFIPSISSNKLAAVSAARGVRSSDQLVVAGAFENLKLNNFAAALNDLAGGNDSSTVLPAELRDGIGNLGLTDASITLLSSDNGYEVAATQFTIGMPADVKPWSLFEGLVKLKFESLDIAVVRPFNADERTVFATIAATTELVGIELYVQVGYPGYYLCARQVGVKTVDLDYFKKEGIQLPKFLDFSFQIADIAFEAQPGSYYSFSMKLAPGTSWKINNEYTLPDLRLAISCETPRDKESYLSWTVGARNNEGDKAVPVMLLVRHLGDQVGIEIPDAPAALEGLTINSLDLAYDSKSESFAIECRGQLPINRFTLDCGFTIAHKSGTNSETHFGGEILLCQDGAEPLSFSLKFGNADDSKYCVAAYYDPNGYGLNIQDLAKSVLSEDQAALIPPSLEISLKSALLAYSQRGQGETEESAVLFGVDLGASIKLSDLPVVGSALPADMSIGFESLRVMVASASLSQESVEKLNSLIPAGMSPLPDESQSDGTADAKSSARAALAKGFNVSAAMLFGKTSKTLTLPIGEDDKAIANPSAVAPPLQPNIQPSGQPPTAAPDTPAASVKWFEIDKSLGPLTLRRVGLSYDAPKVGIKFDASLQLSVLTFNLEGLGLNYTLGSSTEPAEILKNLDFTLDGMGLSLGSGPIEIGGSLVRVPGKSLELEGALLIRTAAFSFSALGSYVDLNGTISVMAFAVLLKELGDPTGTGAFVVTGLAFGFGVNRKLTIPPIEQVQNFPLIQAAMGKQDLATVAALPRKLRDHVSPSVGDFWIAAGIKVNSFVVLDSFLLLSVSWGAEVEIGLLGVSRMTMPPLAQPAEAIASAELSLRGVIRIADGLIQFEARLTENSFIFSKACRLTGGFAFCVWFAGPHAGDFVVSLGGYHPAFIRPAHYPLVPRLGMQLQIGKELSITGEAYFALTTSCVMAGGKLSAIFKSGGIEAWFIAYVDFLMSWQPFYYMAAMGVTLGIALRLGAIRLRLELSVELKLQGPPFGGEARVTLWIISFTIPFGAPASVPLPLSAPDFVKKCLPAPNEAKSPDIFSVRITSGLLREQEIKGKNHPARIVNAHRLSLTVQSVIPCTEFAGVAKGITPTASCGIRPMGKTNLHSVFTVTADGILPGKHVKISAITGNLPDAVWGKSEKEGLVPLPKEPERKTIQAALGVQLVSIPQEPANTLPAIAIEKFKHEFIAKSVDWSIADRPSYVKPEEKWSKYNTIWTDDSVRRRRDDILQCLREQMPPDLVLNEPQLERLSTTEDYFQHQPEMNAVGY